MNINIMIDLSEYQLFSGENIYQEKEEGKKEEEEKKDRD